MSDASPIENTVQSPCLSYLSLSLSLFLLRVSRLSPSALRRKPHLRVLRITRGGGGRGNRRNEIAPSTRNRPSRFAIPLARTLARSPASIEYSKLSSRKKLSYPPWRCAPGRLGGSGSVSFAICGSPRQFGETISPLRIHRFFKALRHPRRDNATHAPALCDIARLNIGYRGSHRVP